MITIKEAEEILKKEYHVDNFLYVVDELLLPDFRADKHDVDFKNTILIMTSNIGSSYLLDGIDENGNIRQEAQDMVMEQLRQDSRHGTSRLRLSTSMTMTTLHTLMQ